MTVRDTNKQKLYDAEHAYWSAPENAGLHATKTASKLRYSSIVEIVDQLVNRLDLAEIGVKFNPNTKGASYYAFFREIVFTGEDAPIYFAIHEVAHALHQDRADDINQELAEWTQGHGPAFVEAYVDTVKEFYGPNIAEDFRNHMVESGFAIMSPLEEAIKNTRSSQAILKDAKSLQQILNATISPNKHYEDSDMFLRTNSKVWLDVEAEYVTIESTEEDLGTTMTRGGTPHIGFSFNKETWALADKKPVVTRKGTTITIEFFDYNEDTYSFDTRYKNATITIDCTGLHSSGTENRDEWDEAQDGIYNRHSRFAPDFAALAA